MLLQFGSRVNLSFFSCIAIILTNLIKPSQILFFKKIVNDISILTDDASINLSLSGSQTYNFEENSKMLKASVKYILSSERFSDLLV